MTVDHERRLVDPVNLFRAELAQERDGLADEKLTVRERPGGSVTMTNLDSRHGAVFVGREAR